jgi:hypothetical protein
VKATTLLKHAGARIERNLTSDVPAEPSVATRCRTTAVGATALRMPLETGISLFNFQLSDNLHLTAAECKCPHWRAGALFLCSISLFRVDEYHESPNTSDRSEFHFPEMEKLTSVSWPGFTIAFFAQVSGPL